MTYLIYGKAPGTELFKAMDLNEGIQVSNLIYATMLYETEEKVKSIVASLQNINPDWEFKYKEA